MPKEKDKKLRINPLWKKNNPEDATIIEAETK